VKNECEKGKRIAGVLQKKNIRGKRELEEFCER
jgi:hypothetical protein